MRVNEYFLGATGNNPAPLENLQEICLKREQEKMVRSTLHSLQSKSSAPLTLPPS